MKAGHLTLWSMYIEEQRIPNHGWLESQSMNSKSETSNDLLGKWKAGLNAQLWPMYKFVHMVDWQTALIKPHGWQPWRRAVSKNQDIKTDIRPWKIEGAWPTFSNTHTHTHKHTSRRCFNLQAINCFVCPRVVAGENGWKNWEVAPSLYNGGMLPKCSPVSCKWHVETIELWFASGRKGKDLGRSVSMDHSVKVAWPSSSRLLLHFLRLLLAIKWRTCLAHATVLHSLHSTPLHTTSLHAIRSWPNGRYPKHRCLQCGVFHIRYELVLYNWENSPQAYTFGSTRPFFPQAAHRTIDICIFTKCNNCFNVNIYYNRLS